MATSLRNRIRMRAENRCEYCRISQEDVPHFPFHIEHIIAKQHGGSDHPDNLAWCCLRCNLHKGPSKRGGDAFSGGEE